VDDPVAARSRPRVDAENLHGRRVGRRADDPRESRGRDRSLPYGMAAPTTLVPKPSLDGTTARVGAGPVPPTAALRRDGLQHSLGDVEVRVHILDVVVVLEPFDEVDDLLGGWLVTDLHGHLRHH
jgi:hypothetical protein